MGHIICLFSFILILILEIPGLMSHSPGSFLFPVKEAGVQPGGYSRFQVTGMIEWGQKSKPKKIPGPKFNPQKTHAEFPSHKNFQRNYTARICGDHTQELSQIFRLFEYPTKSLLKSSYPKKYLPNFPYPKKSWNQKFQTSKNRSIIPVTWNPEYLPWELGVMLMAEHENNPAPGC